MMYFESHITLGRFDEATVEAVKRIADRSGWRYSEFHGDFDPGIYLSNRHSDINVAQDALINILLTLRIAEIPVSRYKIELVVVDSKTDDSLYRL